MNDLHKALGDISSIRMQMARSSEFRGYGPATLALTAILAVVAALFQRMFLPDAGRHIHAYLGIWIATALLSAVVTGAEMYRRTRRMHIGLSDEMLRMAVEQFVPSLAAGTLITAVLVRSAPEAAWMLPGLWQVIFSLGVFSSCRFLPKAILAAAVWYLVTGLSCLALGDARALSPWAMAIPFGVGQMMVAGVLFLKAREVDHEG